MEERFKSRKQKTKFKKRKISNAEYWERLERGLPPEELPPIEGANEDDNNTDGWYFLDGKEYHRSA